MDKIYKLTVQSCLDYGLNIIFIVSAPRPIQSISRNVREEAEAHYIIFFMSLGKSYERTLVSELAIFGLSN